MPTCRGTAISVATKAVSPRTVLFVATAVEDRPVFASTMYASVDEEIHLPSPTKKSVSRVPEVGNP
jgi:hypothetical protein